MAWFGLVKDKFCDLCGEKLGVLFDNNSLKDGKRICNDCEGKLSPFFTRRGDSTLDEIKQQLEYRENNKQAVAAFNPVTSYGYSRKVYVAPAVGKFCVATGSDWRSTNPDIIDLSQVIRATVDVREKKTEVKVEGEDGRMVSCDPPEYEYSYDFHLDIEVNSPWFSHIHVDLTDDSNLPESRGCELYRQYDAMSRECAAVLMRQAMPGAYTQNMNMTNFSGMSIMGAIGAVLGAVQNAQQGMNQMGQMPMQPGMNQMGQMPMQPGMNQMGQMPMQQGMNQMGQMPMQQGMNQMGQMPMQQGMNQMGQMPMQQGMNQMGQMPMQQGMNQMNQMPQQGMNQMGQMPQAGARFCSSCGAPATGKFCPNCGSPLA